MIRIDFERASSDKHYCEMIIDDLERDIISGDDLDCDRLLGILGMLRRLNESVRMKKNSTYSTIQTSEFISKDTVAKVLKEEEERSHRYKATYSLAGHTGVGVVQRIRSTLGIV